MKYCNCRDVTSVYSLNSRKLPGRFSYGLGTRLEPWKMPMSCWVPWTHVGTLIHYKVELQIVTPLYSRMV